MYSFCQRFPQKVTLNEANLDQFTANSIEFRLCLPVNLTDANNAANNTANNAPLKTVELEVGRGSFPLKNLLLLPSLKGSPLVDIQSSIPLSGTSNNTKIAQ